MGRDKATLPFRGRPMVEIAVEKLRGFCAQVSIAGNRDDLAAYAPVVHEERVDVGPAAGIDAGLKACEQPWAMFVPVDVPLVPAELLRRWAASAMDTGAVASYLLVAGAEEPAFALVKSEALAAIGRTVDAGERRVVMLWRALEDRDDCWVWAPDAEEFGDLSGIPRETALKWFANVNTERELAEAEAWADGASGAEADPLRG